MARKTKKTIAADPTARDAEGFAYFENEEVNAGLFGVAFEVVWQDRSVHGTRGWFWRDLEPSGEFVHGMTVGPFVTSEAAYNGAQSYNPDA
jgi:hypothetical protein